MDQPKRCVCGSKFITAACNPDMEAASHGTVSDMRRNYLDCADPPGEKIYHCMTCGAQGAWKPTMAEALAAWNAMVKPAEK